MAIIGFGFALPLQLGLLGAGTPAAGNAHVTPAYIPGAYLSLSCAHSSIATGGSTVCHDGNWGPTLVCGGGTYCSFSYTETMDHGYTLNHWGSQGAACIGTQPTCNGLSTSSTVSVWMYGPSTGKSQGTLGVNIAGHGPGCSTFSTTSVTGVTATGGASSNAANVYAKLAWTVSTAGGTTWVEWGGSGPLAGYDAGWTSFSSSSTSQSYTINGLKPGATMYYSIDEEPGGCNIGGVATGSFTSPSGSTSQHVYGYVYDGSTGKAFSAAHVVAYWTCNYLSGGIQSTTTATVFTASDGSYDIPTSSNCGVGTTWSGVLNWSAYASGYWRTEYTPSAPLTSFDGVNNWQIFAVVLQTISPTWTGLAYVNGNADAACSISSSYAMSTTVSAYLAGSGGSATGSYTSSSTFAGATGNGLATYFGYANNGVLEVASDGLTYSVKNAWVSGTPTTGTATFTSTNPTMPSDYLSAAPSGTPIISLAAGTTGTYAITIGGSATLQVGVIADVGFSVGFLGIVDFSVSATLQLTWSETTAISSGISCTLGHSTSTGTEKFQLYVEDSSSSITGYNGLVVHLWQL